MNVQEELEPIKSFGLSLSKEQKEQLREIIGLCEKQNCWTALKASVILDFSDKPPSPQAIAAAQELSKLFPKHDGMVDFIRPEKPVDPQ